MVKSIAVGDDLWVVMEKGDLRPPHSILKTSVGSTWILFDESKDKYFTAGIANARIDGDRWTNYSITAIEKMRRVDVAIYDHGYAFFTNRQDAEDFRDRQKMNDLYGDWE